MGCTYIGTQVNTIYGGDAGDLVSAIVTRGIPHPPGYPFYTSLGIAVTSAIPFGTAAWKSAFLSSIPSAIALFILYKLLILIGKRVSTALIAVLILGFSYLYWLYSSVVEVFSLNNLFLVTLLYLSVRLIRSAKIRYFYLLVFVFSLSLTHHQIILFLVPAMSYFIWKSSIRLKLKNIIISFLLFISGLVPYLYAFISAARSPAINWMGSPDMNRFIDLILRKGYGTFTVGPFVANDPVLRLINLYGFLDLFYKDFRISGIILAVVGLIYLFWKERRIWTGVVIALLSYFFFLFYASFPLPDNFMIGTFERFILPLYIIITIFISYGILAIFDFFKNAQFTRKMNTAIVGFLVTLIFFVYPLGLIKLNYGKINILKNDQTAENLGRDILASLPKNAVFIIAADTPLFDTQYVYYAEKVRPDVKLIHFSKLFQQYYLNQLKYAYPDVYVPTEKNTKDFLDSFLTNNSERFPVYSKLSLVSDKGEFISQGLVYRYYGNDSVINKDLIYKENNRLWGLYHNPLSGDSFRYRNLTLSTVLKVYAEAHEENAVWDLLHEYNSDAEHHAGSAMELMPGDPDILKLQAQVFVVEKKCDEAKSALEELVKKRPDNSDPYYLMSINYQTCYNDAANAAKYIRLYDEKKRESERTLKKL